MLFFRLDVTLKALINFPESLIGKKSDSSGRVDLKTCFGCFVSATLLSLLKMIVDFISQQQMTGAQVNVI